MTEAEILERVRASGLRVTPQRRAVAAALAGPGSVHLTAEAVHQAARGVVPEVARATVYNILNELVDRGVLQTVAVDGGAVRFDPNTDASHHFICTRCGEVLDVEPTGVEAIRVDPALEVDRVELVVRGRCTACRD